MFPSPSLGPPLLSESLSPAFAPCGIPDELEAELDDVEVAAGVDEAGVLDEDGEDDPPPPQPATKIAIRTSVPTSAAGRRGEADKSLMSYLSAGWCLSSGEASAQPAAFDAANR